MALERIPVLVALAANIISCEAHIGQQAVVEGLEMGALRAAAHFEHEGVDKLVHCGLFIRHLQRQAPWRALIEGGGEPHMNVEMVTGEEIGGAALPSRRGAGYIAAHHTGS